MVEAGSVVGETQRDQLTTAAFRTTSPVHRCLTDTVCVCWLSQRHFISRLCSRFCNSFSLSSGISFIDLAEESASTAPVAVRNETLVCDQRKNNSLCGVITDVSELAVTPPLAHGHASFEPCSLDLMRNGCSLRASQSQRY